MLALKMLMTPSIDRVTTAFLVKGATRTETRGCEWARNKRVGRRDLDSDYEMYEIIVIIFKILGAMLRKLN